MKTEDGQRVAIPQWVRGGLHAARGTLLIQLAIEHSFLQDGAGDGDDGGEASTSAQLDKETAADTEQDSELNEDDDLGGNNGLLVNNDRWKGNCELLDRTNWESFVLLDGGRCG